MTDRQPSAMRAVVLLYPGCTIAEVIELATRLADAGVEVGHVSVDGVAFADRSGLRLQPDTHIEDVDGAALDLVVVPGGDPAAIVDEPDVAGLLQAVAAGGGVVAGICAGVVVLAAAGLVRGRRITHNYRSPWAPAEVVEFTAALWDGAEVEADPSVGVVEDGPIITALPNATIAFTATICRRLGLYDTTGADRLERHLRGDFVAELFERR